MNIVLNFKKAKYIYKSYLKKMNTFLKTKESKKVAMGFLCILKFRRKYSKALFNVIIVFFKKLINDKRHNICWIIK